jgi:predicted aminopeptidase
MGETDTPRQRELAHHLAGAGETGSWRRFLIEQKEAGRSNQAIAYDLRARYALAVDASTVAKWLRQAVEESGARERTREKRAAQTAAGDKQSRTRGSKPTAAP